MTVIERGTDALKKVAGLVFPMFARARDFATLGVAALWGLRLAALATVLGLLAALNAALGLSPSLKAPQPLKQAWLPLLFLLIYAFLWLVRWFWSQLGPEREEEGFPDIDRAWDEARLALDRAGVELNECPVFLVVGRPQGAEEVLFDAAGLHLKVRGQPGRDDAPIRVYANRDAIFVTCAGASVLGRHSAAQDDAEFVVPAPAVAVAEHQTEFMTLTDFQTLGPGGPGAGVEAANVLERARIAGRGPDQLRDEELRALGRFAAEQGDADPRAAVTSAGSSREKADSAIQTARLRHLGRRIARDRRPYCPINGILLLIPVSATNTDHAATRVGLLCQRDLATVRKAVEVRCPVFALMCDLETLPGFRELIQRLPDDQKRRRMGQRFPLIPDVEPAFYPAMYEGGVQWIAAQQFPAQVDQLWRVEGSDASMAESMQGNIRLYQLLRQFRDRQRRLSRILIRAVMTDGVPTSMLGGCYLAGTGADPRSEQAFLPGVFRRLLESQDNVAWTPELIERESRYHRWTRQGYVAMVALATLYLGIIVLVLALRASAVTSGGIKADTTTSARPG